MDKMFLYDVGGVETSVAGKDVREFKADPEAAGAEPLQAFDVDGETLTVAKGDLKEFRAEYPGAKPLTVVEDEDGAEVELLPEDREAFVREKPKGVARRDWARILTPTAPEAEYGESVIGAAAQGFAEEFGTRAKALASYVPYLGVEAARGLLGPFLEPLRGTAFDSNAAMDTAAEYWRGKTADFDLPVPDIGVFRTEDGLKVRPYKTSVAQLAGQAAGAAGSAGGAMRLSAGAAKILMDKVLPQATPALVRAIGEGLATGALMPGAKDAGDMAENAVTFALYRTLGYAIGKAPQAVDGIAKSNWWRKATIRERGLVLQDMATRVEGMKAQGMGEAQILRTVKRVYGEGSPEFKEMWRKVAVESGRTTVPGAGERGGVPTVPRPATQAGGVPAQRGGVPTVPQAQVPGPTAALRVPLALPQATESMPDVRMAAGPQVPEWMRTGAPVSEVALGTGSESVGARADIPAEPFAPAVAVPAQGESTPARVARGEGARQGVDGGLRDGRKATSVEIIPNSKALKITNLDQLPRGTGARYLEVVKGENGVLVAKQWRRKPVSGAVLVDTESDKPAPAVAVPAQGESTSGSLPVGEGARKSADAATPPELAERVEIRDHRLMTPEEYRAFYSGYVDGNATAADDASAVVAHKTVLRGAFDNGADVSAAAVDQYKLKLPKGYTRQGDRYTRQGADAATPISTAASPQSERGTETASSPVAPEAGTEAAVGLPAQGEVRTAATPTSAVDAARADDFAAKWAAAKDAANTDLARKLLVDDSPDFPLVAAELAQRGASLTGAGKLNNLPKLEQRIEATGAGVKLPKIKAKTPAEAADRATSTDSPKLALHGVYHDAKAQRVVATDGKRLVAIPAEVKETKLVAMSKKPALKLGKGDAIDAVFPNYSQVMADEKFGYKATRIDPDDVRRRCMAAVAFAKSYGKSRGGWDRQAAVAEVAAQNGDVMLMNAEYLLDGVEILLESGAKSINLLVPDQGKNPVMLKGDNGATYLQMPFMSDAGYRKPAANGFVAVIGGQGGDPAAASSPAKPAGQGADVDAAGKAAKARRTGRAAGIAAPLPFVPGDQDGAKMARNVGRWTKRWFSARRNMDPDTLAATVRKRQETEAARVRGMAVMAEFRQARDGLAEIHGRDAVQEAMRAVVYGEETPADFAARFGLAADAPAVRTLERFAAERDANRNTLADLLERTGNKALAEAVAGNEAYVSRIYLRHLMGKDFEPDAEDYRAAVEIVRAGYEDAVNRIAERAGEAAGKSFGGAVADYLNTGNESALAGMSATRREEVVALRNAFLKVSRAVESVEVDLAGNVNVTPDPAALIESARSAVDYFLKREGGGGGAPDVSPLRARFLDEAFRKLYGEVTDPVFAAAQTAESQARMVAHLAFFDSLVRTSENKAWSGMPSDELGTTKKLPDDARRYGRLAGKFVTPELYDAIHGSPAKTGLDKYYAKTLGTMRLLKLWGPRTIVRNYVTNITGYALASGDMQRAGYKGYFDRGHALAAGVIRKDPAAMRELEELVAVGAFSFRGNTAADEVARLLTLDPTKRIGARMEQLGDLYSMIDLPTKAASYWMWRDRYLAQGLPVDEARARAADWVKRHYQNPRELPAFAGKLSEVPLGDFHGFFFDSMRIRLNQINTAYNSARGGDLVPLVGLLASAGVSAGLYTLGGKTGRELFRKARRALAGEEQPASVEEIDGAQALAMRGFLPSYLREAPLQMWTETGKDGKTRAFYAVTGNQTAFPLEDILYGAWQQSEDVVEFLRNTWSAFRQQRLQPGMLFSALYRAATGDDIQGNWRGTGLDDVIGRPRPDKDRVFRDAALGLGSDIYGGQFGYRLKQAADLYEREQVGQNPTEGSYRTRQTYGGIISAMLEPVRTYEIGEEDAARMLRNRLREYSEGLQVAKDMVRTESRETLRMGAAPKSMAEASGMGQEARKEYVEAMGAIVRESYTAFRGVITTPSVFAAVKDALPGASTEEIAMIFKGVKSDAVKDYEPTPSLTMLQQVDTPEGITRALMAATTPGTDDMVVEMWARSIPETYTPQALKSMLARETRKRGGSVEISDGRGLTPFGMRLARLNRAMKLRERQSAETP